MYLSFFLCFLSPHSLQGSPQASPAQVRWRPSTLRDKTGKIAGNQSWLSPKCRAEKRGFISRLLGRRAASRLSEEESDGQKLRFKRLSLAALIMPHAMEERQGVGRREKRGVGKRPVALSRPAAVRAGDSWQGDSGMRGRDCKCREAPPKGSPRWNGGSKAGVCFLSPHSPHPLQDTPLLLLV